MDFVDEEKRALPHPAALARGVEGLLEIGDAGENGRELLEMELERRREQPRDGRLARARRAPENDRVRPALRDHAANGSVRSDDVVLTDDLAQ